MVSRISRRFERFRFFCESRELACALRQVTSSWCFGLAVWEFEPLFVVRTRQQTPPFQAANPSLRLRVSRLRRVNMFGKTSPDAHDELLSSKWLDVNLDPLDFFLVPSRE